MSRASLPADRPSLRLGRPTSTRICVLGLMGVCAVAAIALGVARVRADQRAAARWIAHTQLVLLQSADLELHLERTVSEGRGYHISRDAADLARFLAAEGRVRADLADLRTSTAEAPEQQRRLEALAPLILGRLALLHRLADIDPASPQYTTLSAPGMLTAVESAQQIADGLTGLRAAATRLLTEQQAAVARTARLTAAAIATGGGLLSASCVLILVLLARHRREHQHLLELGALNQALEERVQARTAELRTAHERMAIATEHGGVGIWDWDVTTGRVFWSRRVFGLYGLDPAHDQPTLALWRQRLHPHDRAATEAALRHALDHSGIWDCEYRIVRDDGSIRTVRSVGRVIRDAAGRPLRMLGSNCDVSEARRLTATLAEQRELLEVTLQAIGDGVITADAAGRVRWLNPAAERMTGWTVAEAAGQPVAQVLHIRHAASGLPAEVPVARCLAEGRVLGLAADTVLISRHGEEFGIADSASPIRNRRGEMLGVVLVFHDVTEQRRLSAEMSYRASHDPLTGLVNRAEFELRLRQTLRRAQEEGSRHALLYLDLDQFKAVNDTCGHGVGDWLLREVARLLRDIVRASDCVARLGGDEFAIILDHCDGGPAERLAARICQAAEDFRFTHAQRQHRLGASIGLVLIDGGWASAGALLEAADAACYAAKTAGRNRVHRWRDTDDSRQARLSQAHWAARLEAALAADGLLLFAQRVAQTRAEVWRPAAGFGDAPGDGPDRDAAEGGLAAVSAADACGRDGLGCAPQGPAAADLPASRRGQIVGALRDRASPEPQLPDQDLPDRDRGARERPDRDVRDRPPQDRPPDDRDPRDADTPAALLHAEVLVRLADGAAAPILPGAFLDAAERLGLAGRLDRWVLSRTLHLLGTHPGAARIGLLAVNLTASSVADRAFHAWTLERLGEAGPEVCRRLCLEFTEAAAAGNILDVAAFVRAVRALGVRVALDDFGAGAPAFATLKTLRADLLKIDARFIRDLAGNRLDGALVRCFADAAAMEGAETVAKGVEDPAVLERVRGIGIGFAQGFLLHRPVPLEALLGEIGAAGG